MSLVNKLTKSFRWLRWSTVCAILFYAFFIGLILHSTSYKLQHTLKSRNHEQQQQQQQQQHQHEQQELEQQQQQQEYQHLAQPMQTSRQQTVQQQLQAQLQNGAKQQLNSVNGNNTPQEPHQQQGQKKHKKNEQKFTSSMVGSIQQRSGSGKTALQRVQTKSGEPETVILAASSVNEKQILEKAFKRADKNQDKRLTIQELGVYINERILEHIEEAIQSNPREFRQVDVGPADGLITWEEYHRYFLKQHGMKDADIDEHNEIRHTALNRKAREDMMRDKARWSEAARTDLFSLTIDEYLSFRHPESSISNLLELVDDLLRQFDQDGDDQLTIEEFSELNIDDDDDLMRKSLISKTKVERCEEFKRIIDKNHDGKADRGELLDYVNPKTPRYALQEAATLFSLCDENKDGKLTLNELVANAEIILSSKMIDTANSFHTEF